MRKLELTEDERKELLELEEWIRDVGAVRFEGRRVGPSVTEPLAFVKKLIARLDSPELSKPSDGAAQLDALDLCGHCLRPREQHAGTDCYRWDGEFIQVSIALAARRVLLKQRDRIAGSCREVIAKLNEELGGMGV
jgi:hypothetical protein